MRFIGVCSMEYWDKNGKIHNDNNLKLNPLQKAYRKVIANISNIDSINKMPSNNEFKRDLTNKLLNAELAMLTGSLGIRLHPQLNSAYKLLFHKPFYKMDNFEKATYEQQGKEYYKTYLNKNQAYNKAIGTVDFTNAQAGEPNLEFMEQYPLARFLIWSGKENKFIPTKPKINKTTGKIYERKDATGFNNLKVRWKGKDYDYQIRENPSLPNPDFYNIKPYELFLKEIEQNKRTP